ncbi:O-antigen ligase family protein [Kribbella sp. NPDC003557]|uniref:O-antigen ligase family protein n=1 Tax=Kribbella sp. NPDC003557 TaxID=3154449 RepID=UPI0033B35FF4
MPPDPGRLFVLYGRALGILLAGYLLFDRAFAYLHLPGSPLFVGEMVLGLGVVAALAATRYFVGPIRDEPVLALVLAFAGWGLIRTVPGLGTYHLDAVRDAALWYYSLFALLLPAAIASYPGLLDRWMAGLERLTPWLLAWLPPALVLAPLADSAPRVPFSTVSVLSRKPGSAAVAALLVLGLLWLLPGKRSARSRALLSLPALLVIALAATQNRGGLLGVMAGGAVALFFVRHPVRLAARVVLVMVIGLGVASLLSLKVPLAGVQGREFSASQLVANVVSLSGKDSPGNLGGTVEGREELWTRILDKQVSDGHLVDGSGFGQNLAAEVGVYDEGKETLRSPHNSHLHILARMGVVGFSFWVALWAVWYWRLIAGCRRLARAGRYRTRQLAVLMMSVCTSVLVSCLFDPQLEGPQIAAVLWTMYGVGIAVTTRKPWFSGLAAEPARPLTITGRDEKPS